MPEEGVMGHLQRVSCVVAALLLLLCAREACANVYSSAGTHVTGGTDQGAWDYTGAPVGPFIDGGSGGSTYTDWTTDAYAYASCRDSVVISGVWNSCATYTPSSAIAPFANSSATFQDDITIEAGSSGLSEGDPVQVRFVSSIEGSVKVIGTPRDASLLQFHSDLWRYNETLAELNVDHYPMSPPQDFEVNQSVNELVTVNVGDTLRLTALLRTELGGTDCGDPGYYEGWIDFSNTGYVHLGYAPGYEDILITSAGGAQILAMPEPTTLSLVALCVMAFLRRRRQ
jgi:hypothetical protein